MTRAATAEPPALDPTSLRARIAAARYPKSGALLEGEAYALLAAAGIAVPRHARFNAFAAARAAVLPVFRGERAVVKVESPGLLHKTESGAVAIVPNTREAILAALAELDAHFTGQPHHWLIAEYLPHDSTPGHELLIGLRWTEDFGAVVTVGPGGVATEFLSAALREGQGVAVLSSALDDAEIERSLAALPLIQLVTRPLRGRPAVIALPALVAVVRRFLALGTALMPDVLAECEVNPLAIGPRGWVALDALARFARERRPCAPPRPLARVERLLRPRTIAVMGVSERMNPGRVIVRNVLARGFPPGDLTVVKPGIESLDGCRCVPSLEALPAPVDLLVLSIAAAQAPAALATAIDRRSAESVILIPGGLGETPGSEARATAVERLLRESRTTEWGGPVINGPNCLGVRSAPGRYDTLFIPPHKFPGPAPAVEAPIAMIAGSGAFLVSKASKLAGLAPRYLISVGNQMDLTLADYLEVLAQDREVEIFALYAEGFRPGDGRRLVEITRRLTRERRPVILYRAGRTAAGAQAAAGHTAAVAGDAAVTRALMTAAGAVVADTLEEFEDLVTLFARLRGRAPGRGRLGALSNAGFEAVAIADHLGGLELATLSKSTRRAIAAILEREHLGEVVAVRHPLDLTPILNDAATAEIAALLLQDPGVDLGLIGCVPMTPALETLAAGPGHAEDVTHETSLAMRLVELWRATTKPWVAVIDGGTLYDPMARVLEEGGVPVFRTADRALRRLSIWANARRPV